MYQWENIKVVMDNLNYPTGVCVNDENNMLLIADMRGHKVYCLDTVSFETREMPADIVESQSYKTIDQPIAVYSDSNSDVFIADAGLNMIFQKRSSSNDWLPVLKDFEFLKEQGIVNLNEPPLRFPAGVTINDKGTIYVNDFLNNSIREIEKYGKISTIIGGLQRGYNDGTFQGAQINNPYGVFWHEGILYFLDKVNNAVRYCDFENEMVHTLKVGNNKLQLDNPVAMDADNNGNFYICEQRRLHYVDFSIGCQSVLIDCEIWPDLMARFKLKKEIGYLSGVAVSKKGEIYWADAENGLIYCAKRTITQ